MFRAINPVFGLKAGIITLTHWQVTGSDFLFFHVKILKFKCQQNTFYFLINSKSGFFFYPFQFKMKHAKINTFKIPCVMCVLRSNSLKADCKYQNLNNNVNSFLAL